MSQAKQCVTNADMISQTGQDCQEDLASLISRQHMAIFGHVRQLPEEAPDWLYGWQLTHGQGIDLTAIHVESVPRATKAYLGELVRQVEIDTGVSADEAWDRCIWRALQVYNPSWSRVADDDDD